MFVEIDGFSQEFLRFSDRWFDFDLWEAAILCNRDWWVEVLNAELKSIPIINILCSWLIWYLVAIKRGVNIKLFVDPPVLYANPEGGEILSLFFLCKPR